LSFLLRWLGRHARWALPAGVFAGIVLPELAALLRPLLTAAVIGTITAVLLRLDWDRLAGALRRPALPAAIAAWQLVGSPLLMWFGAALIGLPPDLRLLLTLQAAAPPIGSAAVFAMILGLDGALAVLATVGTTLLLPFTLTPLAGLLLQDTGLRVDLPAFFARVTLVVAAPFALAWAIRRVAGRARLARNDELLAGANVLLLVVFATGVMDGVTARFLREPQYLGLLLLTACVSTALLHLAGFALFRRAGVAAAYGAALASGNRNMGLMLAITAGSAGEAFALYVGLVQIPMYFAPLALTPFVRRSRI
jgi:BASS family bile acid:Na+ symporter